MSNCPICGRHLGTFTNDPILTTPSLSTDQYKGFAILLAQHIKEIQDERHQQEIDNGVSPLTTFSPINIINLFQNIKQYILELRESTEKILVATGMSLSEFLSTDEDGNPMTSKSDWTDPNLEEIKYQCKAIHIEDLRHYIQVFWQETWEKKPSDYIPPQIDPYPYDSIISNYKNWVSTPGYWQVVYNHDSNQSETPFIHADHTWVAYLYERIQMYDWQYSYDWYPRNDTAETYCHFLRNNKITFNGKSQLITSPNRGFGYPSPPLISQSSIYMWSANINFPTKFKVTISDITKTLTKSWFFNFLTYWGCATLDIYMKITIHGITYTVFQYKRYESSNPTENYIIDIDNVVSEVYESPVIDGGFIDDLEINIQCYVNNTPFGVDQYLFCNLLAQLDLDFDIIKIQPVTTP